jgi:LDH2 family malate/lactate/ureidoglycolate dehydrogenase
LGKETAHRITLTVAAARALGERALRGIGYDVAAARIIADHVIDAALCGYEYSGLAKILNIAEHPRFKAPSGPMRVLRETAVSTLFDGGNAVGMLALHHAAKAAIAKAEASGIALIGVTNTWMSGRSAHFVEMIARADLAAIHTASSTRMVAPLGGTRPILGTNPIAFAVPSAGDPVIFDMGTSAFMMTELMLRERLGQELPPGVALDAAGEPTRDPAAARAGALLPFGGHKGFGLGFFVHAFGVLAGASLDLDGDNGYLFIAFKPDLLVPLAEVKRDVAALIERVKAVPRQADVAEIRVPSEQSFRNRARALAADRLEIDRSIYDALENLAARR